MDRLKSMFGGASANSGYEPTSGKDEDDDEG